MEVTGGLILCGGKSSRMGHDKATLRFEGETLLQRVLGRMGQVASPVVLSLSAKAPAPELPPNFPSEVIITRDEQPERGPLWGLLEGFRALAGKAQRILVLPVDMPFFTVDWMRRLEAGLAGERACLCQWEGFANALTAAYRMDLLPKLEALVAAERMRPLFLSQDEPTHVITVEDHWQSGQGPPPMMDVDTPEAYRDALLMEGIGNAEGVPVIVEWGDSGPGAQSSLPQSGLPLFAKTAVEALGLAGRLYPEFLPALQAAGSTGGFELLAEDGSQCGLDRQGVLGPGMRIAVALSIPELETKG